MPFEIHDRKKAIKNKGKLSKKTLVAKAKTKKNVLTLTRGKTSKFSIKRTKWVIFIFLIVFSSLYILF